MEETLGVWLELAQVLASRAEELTGFHRAMGTVWRRLRSTLATGFLTTSTHYSLTTDL